MIFDEMTTMRKLMLLHGVFDSKSIEEIATGNPLTFVTDLARPLKSLLIPFTPKQEGSGDPSPENIRPILPWNGLTVFGGGKNLIQDNKNLQPIFMPKGTKLFASIKRGATSVNNPSVMFYTENKTIIDYWTLNNAYMDGRVGRGFTLTDDVYWFSIVADDANALERQLEIGASGSSYEPYVPITDTDIVFPSPVYGGTLDVVSGVLTVDVAIYNLTDIAWRKDGNRPGIFYGTIPDRMNSSNVVSCSSYLVRNEHISQSVDKYISGRDDYGGVYVFLRDTDFAEMTATEMKNAVTGQCAFRLATPQEIQLTPAQLTALVGNNTIWSDADGSMTAVYLKKG